MDLYGKSHYIPRFTRRNAQGEQETACRLFAAWLDGLELDARGDARELRIA